MNTGYFNIMHTIKQNYPFIDHDVSIKIIFI